MTGIQDISNDSKDKKRDQWFQEFVSTLRVDEQAIKIDAIDPEKRKFYDQMIFGDMKELVSANRDLTSKYFIANMLRDYFNELTERKVLPLKIAFDLSNSKILVWVEIKMDDYEIEKSLILSEAVVNAKYSQHGFYIYSTIVEDCDNLSIPPHYNSVKIKA